MLARRALMGIAAAVLAVGVAGCGSGSSPGPGGGGGPVVPSYAKNFTPPKSGCGSYSMPMPPDPQGVVAALPKEQRDAFAGYANYPGSSAEIKLSKSRWANFKAKHPNGWKIGIIGAPNINDFAQQFITRVPADLKKSPNVKQVVAQAPATADTGQQLQEFDTVSHSGVDLMIAFFLQPQPFARAIKDAADRGIPTISAINPIPSADGVNVSANVYQGAVESASYATKVTNGKGNWLYMRGLAGSSPDLSEVAAWDAVAKKCPNINVIKDDLYGIFSDATAKSLTLRYLATHRQPIDTVMEVAYMATGVMSAFQQAGRDMPLVVDSGATKGSLGYWINNRPAYHGVATGLPPLAFTSAISEVALRMLGGQGLKLNAVVAPSPIVTDANLPEWANKSWKLSTPGGALGPPNSFMTSSYLDGFFKKPAPVAISH
jgi:ABC-type sugar transport system substrate-binding protein